jgi:hypothetical protein
VLRHASILAHDADRPLAQGEGAVGRSSTYRRDHHTERSPISLLIGHAVWWPGHGDEKKEPEQESATV